MAGDMYLENLEEFIFDEDKLVTYRWLSQTLSVHVNKAKQMLETFVQRRRGKASSPSVSVTYLLSGVQAADNGVNVNKVLVVADKDLEKTEAAMAQVLSKHVYSVQKASLKDSNSLYATDYDIIKENLRQPNKFSAIQCAAAKPRTSQELSELGDRASRPATDSSSSSRDGGGSQQRHPKVNGSAEKRVVETLGKPGPQRASAAGSRPKKGQITAFGGFAPDTKPRTEPAGVKTEEPKQPTAKPKGGMMVFLSRPSAARPKAEDKSPPRGAATITVTTTATTTATPRPPETAPAAGKAAGAQKHSKTGGKAKRKAAKIDVSDSDSGEERQSTKRRRRIIQQDVSSSSSDDELSDMEDSPIPPTPPPPPVDADAFDDDDEATTVANGSSQAPAPRGKGPATTTTSPGGGKRRRKKRVLRNKTTIDEDGCMVTEKVYESDWTDVSEDDAPPAKRTTPAPSRPRPEEGGAKTGGGWQEEVDEEVKQKKKTSPGSVKGKQRSLMSFFKKK